MLLDGDFNKKPFFIKWTAIVFFLTRNPIWISKMLETFWKTVMETLLKLCSVLCNVNAVPQMYDAEANPIAHFTLHLDHRWIEWDACFFHGENNQKHEYCDTLWYIVIYCEYIVILWYIVINVACNQSIQVHNLSLLSAQTNRCIFSLVQNLVHGSRNSRSMPWPTTDRSMFHSKLKQLSDKRYRYITWVDLDWIWLNWGYCKNCN